MRGRRLVCLALFVVCCGIWAPRTARADFDRIKIAVLDFDLRGEGYETEDMGSIVAEWFITALVNDGRFDVVERRLLQKVLEEQKLSVSGVVDESSATQLGRLLGVKAIISGSLMRFSNVMEVNARIIDVESASIIAAESVKSTTAIRLEDLVIEMSDKIIKDFPLEGYIVYREGDRVTIDLGRRAGVRPGMHFIVYKEGAVMKHPKTGEVLDVEKIRTGEIEVLRVQDKIAVADVRSEKAPGMIQYGQLVKSSAVEGHVAGVPADLAAPNPPPPPAPSRSIVTSVPREVPPSRREPAPEVVRYIQMLHSSDPREVRNAAKTIMRNYLHNEDCLDAAEEVLLQGYKIKPRDGYHVDAMSWIAKVLKASNLPKYRATLSLVAHEAPNDKLRKYAR